MKRDIRSWAVKIRNRSFYSTKGMPVWIFATRAEATAFAESLTMREQIPAKPIRVKIRIEEVS